MLLRPLGLFLIVALSVFESTTVMALTKRHARRADDVDPVLLPSHDVLPLRVNARHGAVVEYHSDVHVFLSDDVLAGASDCPDLWA